MKLLGTEWSDFEKDSSKKTLSGDPVDYKPLSVNVKVEIRSPALCGTPNLPVSAGRFGVLNENVNRDAPQPTATDDGECGVCVQSRKASYEENSSEYYHGILPWIRKDHRNFLVSCESSGKKCTPLACPDSCRAVPVREVRGCGGDQSLLRMRLALDPPGRPRIYHTDC